MISLRDNRLQIMSGTGRVLLTFFHPPEVPDYPALLETCRYDFGAIGMPHVFGIEMGGLAAQERLVDEMEFRKLKFEHWSSIGVSRHAFFGFASLHDAMLARLLI